MARYTLLPLENNLRPDGVAPLFCFLQLDFEASLVPDLDSFWTGF